MAVKKKKIEELMYKEKPLVRRGNTLYYGFIDEKYIVKIVEESSEEISGTSIGNKVTVQLTTNNTKLQGKERIIRQSKKEGLFDALDVGVVWLQDVLDYDGE